MVHTHIHTHNLPEILFNQKELQYFRMADSGL